MVVRRYKDYIARWEDNTYSFRVQAEAKRILSDGCSGVSQAYKLVCEEHDIGYAFRKDFWTGEEITQEDADRYLRWGIQYHSFFGRWSPMAWWRYWALSEKKGLGLGRQSWNTGPERLKLRLAEPNRKFDEEHIEARKMMGT